MENYCVVWVWESETQFNVLNTIRTNLTNDYVICLLIEFHSSTNTLLVSYGMVQYTDSPSTWWSLHMCVSLYVKAIDSSGGNNTTNNNNSCVVVILPVRIPRERKKTRKEFRCNWQLHRKKSKQTNKLTQNKVRCHTVNLLKIPLFIHWFFRFWFWNVFHIHMDVNLFLVFFLHQHSII